MPQFSLEPANQVTLDELCEVKTKTVPLAKYGGKTITYRTMVPLDVLAQFQALYMSNGKRDLLEYFKALLKYVLVGPAVQTEAQARALIKADAAVMLQIIGEVTSPQEAQDIKEALEGSETLPNASPA